MKKLGLAALLMASACAAGKDTEKRQPVAEAAPGAPTDAGLRSNAMSEADKLKFGMSAAELEAATTHLGKPLVSFEWCNSAGCVQRGSNEVGATQMDVTWITIGTAADYSLAALLCGGSGRWTVKAIWVMEHPKGSGGFGTAKEPKVLTRRESGYKSACWNGYRLAAASTATARPFRFPAAPAPRPEAIGYLGRAKACRRCAGVPLAPTHARGCGTIQR